MTQCFFRSLVAKNCLTLEKIACYQGLVGGNQLELDDDLDPSTGLADAISNETSWCVNSFRFEEVPAPAFKA
jgi:hypothetical protein